ncbi:hypothetical protein GALMADRAFT_1034426 [Galerina marginata CBS 339.88]|uniref:Uncharacterized protein n=1 Tax=Galerina marginata (strain CBS 339.88) TaxID=685588 RepID=A0A067SC87_GALM3|nr:hypothetical protein GALMADRAFT_1034426 [Galerina marginata CBS 339.88]
MIYDAFIIAENSPEKRVKWTRISVPFRNFPVVPSFVLRIEARYMGRHRKSCRPCSAISQTCLVRHYSINASGTPPKTHFDDGDLMLRFEVIHCSVPHVPPSAFFLDIELYPRKRGINAASLRPI